MYYVFDTGIGLEHDPVTGKLDCITPNGVETYELAKRAISEDIRRCMGNDSFRIGVDQEYCSSYIIMSGVSTIHPTVKVSAHINLTNEEEFEYEEK